MVRKLHEASQGSLEALSRHAQGGGSRGGAEPLSEGGSGWLNDNAHVASKAPQAGEFQYDWLRTWIPEFEIRCASFELRDPEPGTGRSPEAGA